MNHKINESNDERNNQIQIDTDMNYSLSILTILFSPSTVSTMLFIIQHMIFPLSVGSTMIINILVIHGENK